MIRKCDNCGKEYNADSRNLKRGWGLCCSKSCAAQKREKNKPGYDNRRVDLNNLRRAQWNDCYSDNPDTPYNFGEYGTADFDQWGDCELGIHD